MPSDLAVASDDDKTSAAKPAVEIGLGANGGAGSYYSRRLRNSIVPHLINTGGVDLQVISGRNGFILAGERQTDSSGSTCCRPEPYDVELLGSIAKAGIIRVVPIQPGSNLQFRLGLAYGRYEIRISDDVLNYQERHKTAGGFASIVLVHTLGDHLSLDVGTSATVLPLEVKFLDLKDPGIQSTAHIGLALRF